MQPNEGAALEAVARRHAGGPDELRAARLVDENVGPAELHRLAGPGGVLGRVAVPGGFLANEVVLDDEGLDVRPRHCR
jgi:hypothetical protein